MGTSSSICHRSTSKFPVESLWKLHRFWKANPRGNYDIDSSWIFRRRIDFQNRRNIDEFFTRNFLSFRRQTDVTLYSLFPFYHFWHFLLWKPILNYSGIMLSRCNFNDIDVITDFGTIGTISFGNIATMQINRKNDKFYFLQNNTNRDCNGYITKSYTYLLQNNTNQSF